MTDEKGKARGRAGVVLAEDAARRDRVLATDLDVCRGLHGTPTRSVRASLVAERLGLPKATVVTILRRAEARGTPTPEDAGPLLADGETVLRHARRSQAATIA